MYLIVIACFLADSSSTGDGKLLTPRYPQYSINDTGETSFSALSTTPVNQFVGGVTCKFGEKVEITKIRLAETEWTTIHDNKPSL